MNDLPVSPPAGPSFAEALIGGAARGYVICVKPRRFEKLPDNVVETFAEIGADGGFAVFEVEADARRQLEQIPPAMRLGGNFRVKEICWLPHVAPRGGPLLDLGGYPFAMRGYLVDRSGGHTAWPHPPGRLGWKDLPSAVDPSEEKPLRLVRKRQEGAAPKAGRAKPAATPSAPGPISPQARALDVSVVPDF